MGVVEGETRFAATPAWRRRRMFSRAVGFAMAALVVQPIAACFMLAMRGAALAFAGITTEQPWWDTLALGTAAFSSAFVGAVVALIGVALAGAMHHAGRRAAARSLGVLLVLCAVCSPALAQPAEPLCGRHAWNDPKLGPGSIVIEQLARERPGLWRVRFRIENTPGAVTMTLEENPRWAIAPDEAEPFFGRQWHLARCEDHALEAKLEPIANRVPHTVLVEVDGSNRLPIYRRRFALGPSGCALP